MTPRKSGASESDAVAGLGYSQFSVDEVACKDGRCRCCSRCCFKGYFWAAVGAIYFFVIFPAGILLVIHGHHKGVALTLCLGVLLLVFCSCCLPASYLCIRRCKKRRRKRELAARALHIATKEKAAFDNAATIDDHTRDDATNYVTT